MRTRYTFDATSGLLVGRNGEPLGRVVSITIDDSPLQHATTERVGDGVGRSSSLPSTTREVDKGRDLLPHTPRPTATQLEREAVQRIWDYWLQISSKRQQLDSKRERIIRNALRLGYSEDEVKRALLGLARSPFHNGQNEQRRSYLEIRYALKGRGDESDDERVEKAMTWAAMYGGQQQWTDPAKVERWLDEVRYTLSQPHRPERQRGVEAHRKLLAAGFTVTRLDRSPWARISR